MTEEEWLACSDPESMLEFFRGKIGVQEKGLPAGWL